MGFWLRIQSFLGFKCRFAYKCPNYQSNGFTCAHPTAERGYCGKYHEFKARTCPKCSEPMLRPVDFGWIFRGNEYWRNKKGGKMKVDVVVCSKDRYGLLKRQIARIKINVPFNKIIVVDSSLTTPKNFYENLEVCFVHTPLAKLGSARQTGLLLASEDYVLFLDDDVIYDRSAIEKLFKYFLAAPENVVAVSGQIVYSDANRVLHRLFSRGKSEVAHSNGCVLMDRKRVLEFGGFNRNVHIGEDVELSSRLRTQGLLWIRCRDAKFYHPTTLKEMLQRAYRNGQVFFLIRKSRLYCFARILAKMFGMSVYYSFKVAEPRVLVYYFLINFQYLRGFIRGLKT